MVSETVKRENPFLIEKWQKIIGVEVKDWGKADENPMGFLYR